MAVADGVPRADPLPDTATCGNCGMGLEQKPRTCQEPDSWVHSNGGYTDCLTGAAPMPAARAIELLLAVQRMRGREEVWRLERAQAADRLPEPLPPVVTRVPAKWVFVDLETRDVWEVGPEGRWVAVRDHDRPPGASE